MDKIEIPQGTEIPNLFSIIVNKAMETGFFTIDELVILRTDLECWDWLTNEYLPIYSKFNPILLNVSDIARR